MKCCLQPGKKKAKRKPLTELYVKENFTEDGEGWQKKKKLERHCEEVSSDLEETKEVQENRNDYFKKVGDQQFSVDGRHAEITVDLVRQVRANMSDNKVNGPEDAVVSEMIKQLPLDNLYNHEVLPRTFHGSNGGAKLVEDCATDLLEETRCRTKEKDKKLQDRYASCTILRLEQKRNQKIGRNCTWEA